MLGIGHGEFSVCPSGYYSGTDVCSYTSLYCGVARLLSVFARTMGEVAVMREGAAV